MVVRYSVLFLFSLMLETSTGLFYNNLSLWFVGDAYIMEHFKCSRGIWRNIVYLEALWIVQNGKYSFVSFEQQAPFFPLCSTPSRNKQRPHLNLPCLL